MASPVRSIELTDSLESPRLLNPHPPGSVFNHLYRAFTRGEVSRNLISAAD